MGKLIFCTGQVTQKPYTFPFSKTKIYSMEELNYYLYNNIYKLNSCLALYIAFNFYPLIVISKI